MKKSIFIIVVIFTSIFLLTGFSKKENTTMEQKVKSELSYLSIELIEMIDGLNNISLNKFKLNIEELKEDVKSDDSSQSGEKDTEDSKNKNSSSGAERIK